MTDKNRKQAAILVVDDEEFIRKMVRRIIVQNGYECYLAEDGYKALELLEQTNIDVVITDISMPKMDGIMLTKLIKEKYNPGIIMMTGFFKDITYEHAITKGADDFIQKPFTTEEFQIRLKRVLQERQTQADLKNSLEKLQKIIDGVINSLSSVVEARDPYTSGHQKRVATLAVAIAREMNLKEDQIHTIKRASIIHDLGKIAIPAEILAKPSQLSDIEFSLIKIHPQIGYNILKDISFSKPVAKIVYQHHERLDGSGYPNGLKGEEILLEARIIAVADVVEAISSHRPYRPAVGIKAALEEISSKRGILYDPDVVDACLNVISKKDFTFE